LFRDSMIVWPNWRVSRILASIAAENKRTGWEGRCPPGKRRDRQRRDRRGGARYWGRAGGACLIDGNETTRSPAQIMHSLSSSSIPRSCCIRPLDEHELRMDGFRGNEIAAQRYRTDHTQNDARARRSWNTYASCQQSYLTSIATAVGKSTHGWASHRSLAAILRLRCSIGHRSVPRQGYESKVRRLILNRSLSPMASIGHLILPYCFAAQCISSNCSSRTPLCSSCFFAVRRRAPMFSPEARDCAACLHLIRLGIPGAETRKKKRVRLVYNRVF